MLEVLNRPTAVSSTRTLQSRLAALNALRFNPCFPHPNWMADCDFMARVILEEGHFLERARAEVAARASSAPTDPDRFIEWFEDLKDSGPGQHDPLFPWLEEHATLSEMKWFLTQEVAGEAGFEDLTALTQLKLPPRVKMELARNYWDEMGRGNIKGMHGPLLEALARDMSLSPTFDGTVTESLVLGNVMAGLAANRRYAYHSVGALGVIEMTAPVRAAAVNKGLKRLGVGAKTRRYFAVHAVLDIKHSEGWNAEAIRPLVEENPQTGVAIAEGALMRLTCGANCFARYREHFGRA